MSHPKPHPDCDESCLYHCTEAGQHPPTCMKTQSENPAGLHLRYIVTKANGEPVDPRARYFVLRFDRHGDDPRHIAACQKALIVYAREIMDHLPQLSLELENAVINEQRQKHHEDCARQGRPAVLGMG